VPRVRTVEAKPLLVDVVEIGLSELIAPVGCKVT
jgi:hypothetical protein